MAIKRPRLVAIIYAFTGLCVALMTSWLLLASCNFSYGFWHDYGGIGKAIDQYGPENKYRFGFHLTTKSEREVLFAGIVRGLHGHVDELPMLQYQVNGFPAQALLTPAEVTHLQDVARLIGVGELVAFVALIVWLGTIAYCLRKSIPFPNLKVQFIGLGIGLVVLGIIMLAMGPTALFYLLHTWIFPDGHAWFFYYQESLMSTMMYAPRLFGWIALEWLALSIAVFAGLQFIIAKMGLLLAKNPGAQNSFNKSRKNDSAKK